MDLDLIRTLCAGHEDEIGSLAGMEPLTLDVSVNIDPGKEYPRKASGLYLGRDVYAYRVASGSICVSYQVEVT